MTLRRETPHRRTSGFTLVEILVSISVLVLLLSLLVIGVQRALRTAKGAGDRQNLVAVKTGVDAFRNDFGFAPPLVKDLERTKIDKGERVISVYRLNDAQDIAELKRRPAPAPPSGWGKASELYDPRYSVHSLPYFLVGALEARPKSDAQVPIDGVVGPGMLEPQSDGRFKVPDALKIAKAAGSSSATGRVYKPMIDTGRAALSVYRDPADPDGTRLELRDREGNAYRYYRWIRGDATGKISSPADHNVPAIVGDPAADPALREASYAVVLAGPDRAFGDEPLALLAERLAVSESSLSTLEAERAARLGAMKDNIVEVGR